MYSVLYYTYIYIYIKICIYMYIHIMNIISIYIYNLFIFMYIINMIVYIIYIILFYFILFYFKIYYIILYYIILYHATRSCTCFWSKPLPSPLILGTRHRQDAPLLHSMGWGSTDPLSALQMSQGVRLRQSLYVELLSCGFGNFEHEKCPTHGWTLQSQIML